MGFNLLTYRDRLKKETEDLMIKVRKLQTFMATDTFYELPRPYKKLRYRQLHHMLDYLEVLGEICELEEITLNMEPSSE